MSNSARPIRDLQPLFEPRSVAVVGASRDPEKWGHWLAKGVLAGADRRTIYLVNRNGGDILGQMAYRSLDELPDAPELVAIAVPAASFEQTVDDALAAGTRAIVAISAGLGEAGPEGRALEQAVVERVRAADAVLLGPNCLGVYDAAAELDLASNDLTPGSIGLVSQSGNVALEVAQLARDYGLGVSRFASLGNQADLEAADLVTALADHEQTKVIVVYCEDFRDGRGFARAAEAAAGLGKPVVLLTVGASEAGARAALSHTGALVSSADAVAAACRAAGIHLVSTPSRLVDLAQALVAGTRPRGRRLAVVSDGGGHSAVAADAAAAAGLALPSFSDDLSARLEAMLPPAAAVRNPVDLAGGGDSDFSLFARVTDAIGESGEIDTVLLTGYIGGYSAMNDEFRRRETEAARGLAANVAATGRPVVVHTMYPAADPAVAMRAGGVPVYRTIEAALDTVVALAEVAEQVPTGVPDARRYEGVEPERTVALEYAQARALVAEAGIELAPASVVTTLEEALDAAAQHGFPVVLKALGLVHKTDAGGVELGLRDPTELAESFSEMTTRLSPEAYSVERMEDVSEGIELIVGCKRDQRFGPLVLVGFGGVYAELLHDVAVVLAPAREDEIARLLESLRGASLLAGARGRPALAVAAVAEAAAALSRLSADRPEVAEIEVNPLLVTQEGVLGLDARAIVRV